MNSHPSAELISKKRRIFLSFGGGLCALTFCWLTLAIMASATYFLFEGTMMDQKIVGTKIGAADYSISIAWIVAFVCVSWLIGSLVLAYLMGLVCAFFWHQLQLSEAPIGWSVIVLLLAISPLLKSGEFSALPAIFALFFVGIFPMRRGLEIGMDWWPQRRYRHFFGVVNDWEREEN